MPPPAPEPLAFTDSEQGSEPRLAVEPEPQNVGGVTPDAADALTDDEPIVVLDDEPALPAGALGYLAGQGIDAATAAAFRVDAVPEADLARLLRPNQRTSRSGCWLPTCDPREPAQIAGLIRLTPAQHHHRFVTPPAGLAGDPAGWTGRRLILTDSPLQAMRLRQRGVTAVAVVDDPAVLPPLADWLATRELVVAGFRAPIRSAIISALGPLGERALNLTLLPEIDRSPAVTLAALGLGQTSSAHPAVTPHLLRDLCAYAVGRIAAGAAPAALQAVGITDPGFVAAFGIGYLPAEVRSALSTEQKAALLGRIYPDAVLVPAYDAQGIVVDALILPADTALPLIRSLHAEPQGLIAPAVSTAFPSVVIVDSLRAAAEHYAAGQRQVVLLRGLPDAEANAARLAANGVRRAVLRVATDQDAIAACLSAAGITLADTLEEPRSAVAEAPAADLVLVEHDRQAERATFQAGDLRIVAEVPWDARSLVGIRIRRGDQEHTDRLDLGAEAQRRRCASSAALRTGITAERIAVYLAQVHTRICALAEAAAAPPQRAEPEDLSDAERAAALALAQAPDLLERIVADLETLGWTADAPTRRFGIMVALSRWTDDPVWLALGAEAVAGLPILASITPPEERIHVSRLTDGTFYQADPAALRHKLLCIDDASRVSPGVATALRVLKRRGAISASRLTPDPVRRQARTTIVEVHGPIAVCTAATAGEIDPQLAGDFVVVAPEASPAQIEALQAARRRRCAQGVGSTDHQRISTRLQHLQRVLAPQPVIIPYAERIDGFGTSPAARREHDTCLTLISAHALLHQHQRQRLDGQVIASEADFQVVATLLAERQAAQDAGLGRHAQRLLAAVWAAKLTTFTMEDLTRLLPDWTRYTYRAALDELVALDYLASPRSGRGTARTYQLHGSPSAGSSPVLRIALRAVGELATVGETASPTPTREAVNG